MRVVCWNLRSGTDAKWDALAELQPDVAVLAETARAPRRVAPSLLGPGPDWHWVGRNPAKGLAVATFGRPSIVVPVEAAARWSVAARVGGVVVIGVWSCPSQSGTYAREVVRAIDAHTARLGDRPVIVAGDFNVYGGHATFGALGRRLRDAGLVSAYHRQRGEPFGAETLPTYFHHGQRERPFHIDFCFVSAELVERLGAVEVGAYDDWVATGRSDHVPLVVELEGL